VHAREPERGVPGSYLRLIDSCITRLKAQGHCRTCDESKYKEEEEGCPGRSSLGLPDSSSVAMLKERGERETTGYEPFERESDNRLRALRARERGSALMLGVRYESVIFGAGQCPALPYRGTSLIRNNPPP